MAKKPTPPTPDDYVRLEGTERRPAPNSTLLGPADPHEHITVTIVLRRRPDGEPVPDFEYFQNTRPGARPRLSEQEFARKYGASPEDVQKVTDFAHAHGLTIGETNLARRSVVASGTVDQMNRAFGVSLGRYEHSITPRRGRQSVKETYRGRDGFIHVPQTLAPIIVGVFGLDNRSVTKRNSADPPGTGTITVPQVRQLYNFPSNTAAGQTIAIFCGLTEFGDGYDINDIHSYFTGLPAGFPQPTITDISVHGSNSGSDPFGEITQDIDICGSAAPGAAIAVYFTSHTQQGWVDCIQRVVHPSAGDPVCAVLSSSYYVCDGDDSAGIANTGASLAWIQAVSALFVDAAIQGVTVCIATGDTGTDSKVGDGKAHVQYPASDPYVLAVGGTTVGNVSGSSFDEYVWNDTFFGGQSGATGGGISDLFPQPGYQSGAGVPTSLNDGHTGRGLPDVAANASPNSGYPVTVGGAGSVGNGTSASAPLWAGLIATINAALGENVGFVNPAIYQIGSAGFRDIVGAPGPHDNGLNGVAGYPAGAGWDACTGWGSPNGTALLGSLHSLYNRALYFIVDKSTFGRDEVTDVISVGGGLYPQAFWVVLEGFSIQQLGGITPALSGAFDTIPGVAIFLDAAGAEFEDPTDLYGPQRIRFPYDIIFSSSALAAFPASGSAPIEDVLTASITVAGAALSADALFELVSGADPYFTNIDPSHNNEFYLSQDLRVFSVANGDTPLPGGPTMSGSDPYAFIQSLVGFMNGSPTYTTPGADQLNALPGQSGYETGDSSVTPLNPSHNQNFNFAIARVRLQDTAMATAPDVRVFFRLWVAPSFDTDFQPSTTYKSVLGTTGADAGHPIFPLPSGTGLMDPSGQAVQSIPFFATDANGTHDYDSSAPNANIRDIQVPVGHDKVWKYFGCFLDVYDAGNQSKFPGTHHCIVAEIAYDDAPIVNAGGVTETPQNSDKLAQRNLQITSSGNPSYPLTHRVPQAFDMRPSGPVSSAAAGQLLNYPDELMIDWGNTPVGSVARLYWPQMNASDVLDLATSLYGTHSFTAADANTIQCAVVKGVTYLPIPVATGKNFAGLFTVDLPSSVRVGQEFRIKVRRVTSRRLPSAGGVQTHGTPQIDALTRASAKGRVMRNWRYVTGTFQVTIPVGTDAALLGPEETTLAVLKWRLAHMSPAYRWYPVLQRYLQYVGGRVQGFGGDPSSIPPSLQGAPGGAAQPPDGQVEGKVCEVVYDCFGRFRGFVLQQCCSDRRFIDCCETGIGELALRACRDRLNVVVRVDEKDRCHICEIRIAC